MKQLFKRMHGYLNALPDMFEFQIILNIALFILVSVLTQLGDMLVSSTGNTALTSSDLTGVSGIPWVLRTWQGWVLIVIFLLIALVYICVSVNAQIIFCDAALKGKRKRAWTCIREGLASIKDFTNVGGLSLVLFILFVIPLADAGSPISIMRNFYLPRFISSVIFANTLYTAGYTVLLIFLSLMVFFSLFSLHFILLKGTPAGQARKESARLIRKNWKRFLGPYILYFISFWFFSYLVLLLGCDLPMYLAGRYLSDQMLSRFWMVFFATSGSLFYGIVLMLTVPFQIMELTRIFYVLTDNVEYQPVHQRHRVFMVFIIIGIILLGLVTGVAGSSYYDEMFADSQVAIYAHRAGGTLGLENTVDGLKAAMAQPDVTGGEIDVQRTSDGYYIINHDSTFKRLTGVDRKPSEMTMAEISLLQITDSSDHHFAPSRVATLEDMLGTIAGTDFRLIIELKGESADDRMAEAVVQACEQYGVRSNVIIMSLNYGPIKYIEDHYPEYETGYCYFFSFGSITDLSCDWMVLEEEAASDQTIANLHDAGKKVAVWTVDSDSGAEHFLSGSADAIITNEVTQAEDIRNMLNSETDLERIHRLFMRKDRAPS